MDGLNPDAPAPIDETRLDGRQLRLILALRWKLILQGMRARPLVFVVRMLVYVGMFFGGLAVAAGAAAGVHHLRAEGYQQAAEAAVHLGYLFAFLWLGLGPLLAFGGNEFLDVTKLFVFPVSHRTVFAGSLIGAFLSPTTFIAAVPAVAVSLGYGGGLLAVVLRCGVALVVVACASVTGQVVVLLMLNLLRSRIWHDVMLVVGPILGAGFFLIWHILLNRDEMAFDPVAALAGSLRVLDALVVLPSWWGARAALAGDALSAAAVVVPVGLSLLLVRVAAGLQRQAFYGEVASTLPARSVRRGDDGKERRSVFRFLPDPVRALAEKDVKLLFREPVVRMMLIQQGAFALLPIGFTLFKLFTEEAPESLTGEIGPGIVFLPLIALLVLVMEVALLLNLLGLEGGGIVHTLLTPVRGAQILWGKIAAYMLTFGSLNAVLGFVVALLVFLWIGRPLEGVGRGLLAAFDGVVATAVLLSITVVASVYFPMRQVARDRRALRQQAGGREGCLMALKNGLTLCLGWCAIVPVILLVHAADVLRALGAGEHLTGWLWIIRAAGVVLAGTIAVAALRAGVGLAGAALERRREVLVAALARTDD